MPCMCGGCERCLTDQGFDLSLPDIGQNEDYCDSCEAEGGVYDPDDRIWHSCRVCNGTGVVMVRDEDDDYFLSLVESLQKYPETIVIFDEEFETEHARNWC